MTANAVAWKRAENEDRHNRVTEQISRDTLSETMANNLRTHGINITKNQIQKLANDELNQREVTKIAESLRHNLATEQNDANANDIRKLDAMLQAGKPTGKSVAALLTSYALNNHMLASLGLSSPIGNNVSDLLDLISNNPIETGSESNYTPEGVKPFRGWEQIKGAASKMFQSGDKAVTNEKSTKGGSNNAKSFKSQERTKETGDGIRASSSSTTESSGPSIREYSRTQSTGSKIIDNREKVGPGFS